MVNLHPLLHATHDPQGWTAKAFLKGADDLRYDDRLKTVMTQPVGDAHDRTVRWRQLVDLLSRPHDGIDPALLDAALTMIRTGMKSVARSIRAATARSIAGRASDPRLVAIFASDRLEVAAPLLAAAPFDEAGWKLVGASASAEVSDFIRTIRGESVTAVTAAEPELAEGKAVEEADAAQSIGEMVARIERLKTKREHIERFAEPAELSSPGPSSSNPMLFRWECDASGQIGWVDGAPRGALIGRSLPGDEQADRRLVRAFTDRLPFDDAPLTFPAPALEGDWRLSGIPAFSPADGRFLGYRGIARREGEGVEGALPAPGPRGALTGDAETLRETIHEIKTPLNAIIGFAEIIDGQYLGPAHRNYRHRAAEIVAQARILLAAIEDLDFAARIQTGGGGAGTPIELGALFPPIAEELAGRADTRGVQLRIQPLSKGQHCHIDQDAAGRLLRRFVGAMIDAAAPGEGLNLSLKEERGRCLVAVTRPASTRNLADKQLLDPTFATPDENQASKLGLGFALRLVRGLARLAGGELRFGKTEITLAIPAARS